MEGLMQIPSPVLMQNETWLAFAEVHCRDLQIANAKDLADKINAIFNLSILPPLGAAVIYTPSPIAR